MEWLDRLNQSINYKELPHIYDDLAALYKTGGADKEYKNSLYKIVNELREKYNVSRSYAKPMKEKLKRNQ